MAQILTQAPETPDTPGPKTLEAKKEIQRKKDEEAARAADDAIKKEGNVKRKALDLQQAQHEADVATEKRDTVAPEKSDATSADQMDPAAPEGEAGQLEEAPAQMDSREILMQMLSGGGQSEREAALLQQMADVQGQQAERHQEIFEAGQERLNKELAKPASANLMPLMKALDGISGKNLSQFYTQPKTQEEKDAQVAALRDNMSQHADKMSKSQLEQLSTMLSVQEDKGREKKLGLLYADAVRREKAAQTMGDKKAARDQAMQYKRDQMGIQLVSKIKDDHAVKRSLAIADEAENVMGLIELGATNPIAAASIPTFVAKASGEVGNLSEADKKPFGGDRAITNRLAQALETWTQGTITPANLKFLREFSATLYNAKNYLGDKRKRELVSQFHAGQKMFGLDELYNIAGVNKDKPLSAPSHVQSAIDMATGAAPPAVMTKPPQVEQADWDGASDEDKAALVEHFAR